jgi:hypothetical protein
MGLMRGCVRLKGAPGIQKHAPVVVSKSLSMVSTNLSDFDMMPKERRLLWEHAAGQLKFALFFRTAQAGNFAALGFLNSL